MSEKNNSINLNGQLLKYSTKINCEPKEPSEVLIITINNPTENMQTDSSDFEGIAIAAWSKIPDLIIKLKYEKYHGQNYKEKEDWDRKSLKLPTYRDSRGTKRVRSSWLHYMRFLYRIMKFREQYGKEKIQLVNKENIDEIDSFSRMYYDALDSKKMIITRPSREGEAKLNDDEIIATETVLENHLEKWFVKNSEKLSGNLKDEFESKVGGSIRLYDQLPCSMFYSCESNKPSCESRIFSAGYFDLWGVYNNELCLFELKKDENEHLGIISELYFYANLMCDMKKTRDVYKYVRNKESFKYRGFDIFWNNEENGKINAFFLVPELYGFIDENKESILNVLNSGNTNIKFDIIIFDQDSVVGNYKEFIEGIR